MVLGATDTGKLYPAVVILGGKELSKIKEDKKKTYTKEEREEINQKNKEIERRMCMGEEWKPSSIEIKKDPKAFKTLSHYRK